MRIIFIFTCFILLQYSGFAQSISDLRQKKLAAEKEIEMTTRLLNEIQYSERASLHNLRLINNRIIQRSNLVSALNEEIRIYQESIDNNVQVIEMLHEDLEQMKKEYAELIRSAYRNKDANNMILFLFSAEDFNKAYRRYLYTKWYTSYRQNQAEIIKTIQAELHSNIAKLEQQNETKRKLIEETETEMQKLAEEKMQQNTILKKLQRDQLDLQKKLNDQRKAEQQLENEIQRLIAEEATKNKEEGGSGFVLTPEQKLIGDSFVQNKNRLPWPVERGIITEHFGVHPHPVLSNVQIRNNGVNITTESGAEVRAIFDGEVSRVFGITGGNTAIIIRHGSYLSVYSNLKEVVVKKGDNVATKQVIGTVYTDTEDNNKSILKFQIWHENEKQDPEEWISW